MASNGASKLAQVIAERITSQTAKPDALELGTIQGDMSLKLDRFAVPIPKGEYMISQRLKTSLESGNRVLVAWVNNGIDPVVIDEVVSS